MTKKEFDERIRLINLLTILFVIGIGLALGLLGYSAVSTVTQLNSSLDRAQSLGVSND